MSKIAILYGTQTGMALHLTNLAAQSVNQNFSKPAFVASLADFEAASLAEIDSHVLCMFLVCTYGEGHPPENAAAFCEWLGATSKSETDLLSTMEFTVLGLGSSNYQFYNQCGKNIFQSLRCLGATAVLHDVALADDSKGMAEEDMFNWLSALSVAMTERLRFKRQRRPYDPIWAVEFTNASLTSQQTMETPTHAAELLKGRNKISLSPFFSRAYQKFSGTDAGKLKCGCCSLGP